MSTTDSRFAEQACLGAILVDPKIAGEYFSVVRADDFLSADLRNVFDAARGLWAQSKPLDAVTVLHVLGDEHRATLMGAMEAMPSASNWREYATIIREHAVVHRWREVVARNVLVSAVSDATEMTAKAAALLNLDRQVQAVNAAMGLTEWFVRMEKPLDYITTGIEEIDRSMFLEKGDFCVIGARPSTGKTAFAIQIMSHMAKKYRVGFFSLETKDAKIYDRAISHYFGVHFGDIKKHAIHPNTYKSVATRSKQFSALQFEVLPVAGRNMNDLQADMLAGRYDVVIIDYLQLIRGKQARYANRAEEVSDISRDLHTFAQRHGVLVIALSQLTRVTRDRAGNVIAPSMDDLRESGQIEQDADQILLMYLVDEGEPKSDRKVKIEKNKEGTLASLRMKFAGAYQTFTARTPQEMAEFDAEEERKKVRKRTPRGFVDVTAQTPPFPSMDLPPDPDAVENFQMKMTIPFEFEGDAEDMRKIAEKSGILPTKEV